MTFWIYTMTVQIHWRFQTIAKCVRFKNFLHLDAWRCRALFTFVYHCDVIATYCSKKAVLTWSWTDGNEYIFLSLYWCPVARKYQWIIPQIITLISTLVYFVCLIYFSSCCADFYLYQHCLTKNRMNASLYHRNIIFYTAQLRSNSLKEKYYFRHHMLKGSTTWSTSTSQCGGILMGYHTKQHKYITRHHAWIQCEARRFVCMYVYYMMKKNNQIFMFSLDRTSDVNRRFQNVYMILWENYHRDWILFSSNYISRRQYLLAIGTSASISFKINRCSIVHCCRTWD